MEKQFNTMYNVGKAKYVINSHDGIKKHQDGSKFFDMYLFKNKRTFVNKQKELINLGYKEI